MSKVQPMRFREIASGSFATGPHSESGVRAATSAGRDFVLQPPYATLWLQSNTSLGIYISGFGGDRKAETWSSKPCR